MVCGRQVIKFASKEEYCKLCHEKIHDRERQQNSPLIPCACACGTLIHSIGITGKPIRFAPGHNLRVQSVIGPDNPFWKCGRYKTKFGYWMVWAPNHPKSKKGYIQEHRLVFEQFHKCCMLPWGEVHHKNGLKDDNIIKNLLGFTKKQHRQIHHKKIPPDRKCHLCRSGNTILNKRTGGYDWYRYGENFLCKKCYDKNRLKSKV